VRITEVLAPGFTLPKFMSTGDSGLSLHDFGSPPFEIVVTMPMLAPRVENPSTFTASAPPAPSNTPNDHHPPTVAGLAARLFPAAVIHDDAATHASDASSDDGAPHARPRSVSSNGAEEMVDELRSLELMEAAALGAGGEKHKSGLDPEVTDFQNHSSYSSVLGDAFHFIDRPKIAVHHSVKKAYKQAMGEAWLPYHKDYISEVYTALLTAGMTAEQIKRKRFWKPRWFRRRCPAYAPKPEVLYKRVRNVFELFGSQLDAKTGKPLFNEAAWEKANNVLKEVLAGHGSDPPGVCFYHPALADDGSIRRDKYGLILYDCVRGNGMVECIHKQLVDCFGRWQCGPRLAKTLLQEWRHRFNQRMSQRRRAGFPKIGHYDTWLIDELQLLVWLNHGKSLYPHWSNSSHYVSTREQMDFVPMQSGQCTTIVNELKLTQEVLGNLTPDMRFLAKQSGTQLPFLPVSGHDECLHFCTNVSHYLRGSTFAAEFMALDWCACADGVSLFPKLPVHMRLHYDKWQRGERAAKHLRKIEGNYDLLMASLRVDETPATATAPATVPATATATEPTTAPAAATATVTATATAATVTVTAAPMTATEPVFAPVTTTSPVTATVCVRAPVVTAHSVMPHVAHAIVRASAPMLVGGTIIGAATTLPLTPRTRAPKTCQLCKRFGTPDEKVGAASHYARRCIIFHSSGLRKAVAHSAAPYTYSTWLRTCEHGTHTCLMPSY
jgi:hypothetical protein